MAGERGCGVTEGFVFTWRELAAVLVAVAIVGSVTWARYFRERRDP